MRNYCSDSARSEPSGNCGECKFRWRCRLIQCCTEPILTADIIRDGGAQADDRASIGAGYRQNLGRRIGTGRR